MRAILTGCLALGAAAFAQGPPPQFTPAGVVGVNDSGKVLIPSHFFRVYGQNLGGDRPCTGSPDKSAREPHDPRLTEAQLRLGDDLVYPTSFAMSR